MPEVNLDRMFDDLRGEASAKVRPPGSERVRATVRQRVVRRRTVGGALAGIVVLAVALGGGSLLDADPRSDTVSPAGRPDADDPVPTPTVSFPASLSRENLRDATLDLPAWPARPECPSGAVRFRDGVAETGGHRMELFTNRFLVPRYADLAGGPEREALARVTCRTDDGSEVGEALLAVTDDGNEPKTLGYVFASDDNARGFEQFSDANRQVTVTVVDEADRDGARRQDRAYQWTGDGFEQVVGPTRFE
jgi:hypothetical protein